MITEIGGTVGDIESLPFLEAARQVRHDVGRDNCFFLHVSLVPYLAPSGELKTKPTQHSVAALRNIGIQPDALVLRADREIPDELKRKICADVRRRRRRRSSPRPTRRRIYDIPKVLHREGLDAYVVRRLGLPFRDVDWTVWGDLLDRVHHPQRDRAVALVGKYVDLPDAYLSVTEALRAGGFAHRAKVEIRWVPVRRLRDPGRRGDGARRGRRRAASRAGSACAASRASSARSGTPATRGVPALGLCLGLQCMVIEAARPSPGSTAPTPPSSTRAPPHPVISTMADQRDVVAGERDMGGTMRLGAYPAVLAPGVVVARLTARDEVSERHRHRYEVNNAYRDRLDRGRPGVSRHVAGRPARRVRRAARRGAPVLRRHAGPPGAQEPADPTAPAVRRLRRARRSPTGRPTGCPSSCTASARRSVRVGGS